MDAALKPHSSTGPPRKAYSMGEITPSVVFSATVSTVALMISSSFRFCVSRPTMRATCFRAASRPCPSAFSTPCASLIMERAASPIQSSSAAPTNQGSQPQRRSRRSKTKTAAMVNSTVEAVSHRALIRRLPPSALSRFSSQLMYFPITRTG